MLKYVFENKSDEICRVQGVCYLHKNSNYIDNGIAKIIDYERLELPENSEFFSWEKPFVQLETTRGCFNSCAFCVSGGDKPVREQSIELIEKRISTIHQKGIKEVRILDRTFNANPKRAIELLSVFCKFPDMNFHLELHPALLTEKMKTAIKKTPKGILHVEAGIQSLNDKVLEIAGRIGEKDKAIQGIEFLCSLKNVDTHTDLIAGLPYYSLSQIYEDVSTLISIGAHEIQLETLKLLPGTSMRNNADSLGIRYSRVSPYEVLETNWIKASELREAMALSRVLDVYYNDSPWYRLFNFMHSADCDFLKKITRFLIVNLFHNIPLSLEKQANILFKFTKINYPQLLLDCKIAWIINGLPIFKIPETKFEKLLSIDENACEIKFGELTSAMRFYFFSENNEKHIFGFDRGLDQARPIFYAVKI